MAITTKDILGTDSISASRITINDNVNTLKSATNNVLDIIDTSTGAIDNSTFGSLKTIKSGIITANTGIVSGGYITLSSATSVINLGSSVIEALTFNTNPVVGITAFGVVLPKAVEGDFGVLVAGDIGIAFYDTSIDKIKFWNGTAFETVTSV